MKFDEIQMKRLAYTCIALALALILQACGRDLNPEVACNFVQNSKLQRVSWRYNKAKFYIHNSVPQEFIETIRAAAQKWNNHLGKEIIQIETVVGGSGTPNRDGYNIIYYMKNWEQNKLSEQARTTIYWTGDRIYEADIRINGFEHKFSAQSTAQTGKVDIESLMVHEFGHVLGLAHVNPELESVMHAHLASGKERREITDFDKDSLKCEYGDS